MIPARALALAALFAFAPPVAARQGKVHFDPTRDLAGYDSVRSSPDKDLYPLDEFESLLGDEMQPEVLAATKKRWDEARAAVDAKLAALAADPRAAFLYRLESRLAKHKFFSKVAWSVESAPEPFAVIVQRPPKDDPQHARSVVDLYGPWLARVAAEFHALVVQPVGCPPRANHGACPLAVLASPGDHQTAVRFLDQDVSSVAGGIYDPKLRLGVGFQDPFGGQKSAKSRVRPLLLVAVVELLHRHHAEDRIPGSLLLTGGLPLYLLEIVADGGEPKVAPPPRNELVHVAAGMLQDPQKGLEQRVAFADLLACVDGASTGGVRYRQLQRAGLQEFTDRNAFWSAFDAQCALWTHFLIDGEGGAHRARWLRYVREVLGGKPSPDASKLAFEGADLRALERAFWSWMVAEAQRVDPKFAVGPLVIDELLAERTPAATEPSAAPEAVAGTAKPQPPEPPLDPTLLAVGADDFESRTGMALVRAQRGDLAGALAALAELAAVAPVTPHDGRIGRSSARIQAAIELRDAWLAWLASKSGRLEVEVGGKRVAAPVAAVEAGTIRFGPNKQGLTTLTVDGIPAADIVRQTEKKDAQGGAEPWVRAWLSLLAGDPKWDRLLKGDAAIVRDLREDAQVWLPTTLRAGRVAAILGELASAPLPASPALGEAGLERVRSLLGDADLPLVLLKKPLLARYARTSLTAVAAALRPAELVRGQLAIDAAGVAKLVYEFDRPVEAEDFTKIADYPGKLRLKYPGLTIGEAQARFAIEGGKALLSGPVAWALPLEFEAPLTVRYTLRFVKREGEMSASPSFDVYVCDDGQESFIRASCFGWIWAVDRASGKTAESSPKESRTYAEDTDYAIEVVHDGARITTRWDDEDRATSQVGGRKRGDVLLWVHSDQPIALERFEIQGKVVPSSYETARGEWIRRELARLGF